MNATGRDLDAAVAMTLDDLDRCSDAFDSVCHDLLAAATYDATLYHSMEAYINVMRYNLTGNVNWRYAFT